MKKILLLLLLPALIYSQYQVKSPYLLQPEKVFGYVDSCAKFWLKAYDNTNGGFNHNVNRQGNVTSTDNGRKRIQTQGRHSYGYTRAFMLTGNESYLEMAEKTLQFMYSYAWDNTNGGWYNIIDKNGGTGKTNTKTAFDQHYAMIGIAANYEATNDSLDWQWLMKAYQNNETKLWDSREDYFGYYDNSNYNWTNKSGKSFIATVDAITTHLLYLYLMTGDEAYKEKLLKVADNILNRLVESMDAQKMGFVEEYDSNWSPDNSETMTIMGHVLKTAWCLGRIYQLNPDTLLLSAAVKLADHVWENGYDHQYGGPYKDYNRLTGQMLMWGNPDTAKAWWQMEQGVTCGLMLYDITKDEKYLQMADETLDFFMKYFVDHQYGEVYQDRTRRGAQTWGTDKGNENKASYHSIELGYYVYLYGNLFYNNKPVDLYYKFSPVNSDRQIGLYPLAIACDRLKIKNVILNDQPYSNFIADSRHLNIPAGTGGKFKVTFEAIGTTGIAEKENIPEQFVLQQNYPNPFNPVTTIKYTITHVETGYTPSLQNVTLKVFDILGREVATLVNENKVPGEYKITFNADGLSSGIYLYKLQAGNLTSVKKMTLIK
ncbi:MAG: T9SS C-terminal target domain-containing protein [Ignavibacteriales bacterium]|nr:MAG: T9SS C-terminal target domain-containing protein [Ignavibacteriales bacterium]